MGYSASLSRLSDRHKVQGRSGNVVMGRAMPKVINRWYRTAWILAGVFAVSTLIFFGWFSLGAPMATPAPVVTASSQGATSARNPVPDEQNGQTSALIVPFVSLGTMLLTAIGTTSTVLLGWRSERRANREFTLKIQQLEVQMAQIRRNPDSPPDFDGSPS